MYQVSTSVQEFTQPNSGERIHPRPYFKIVQFQSTFENKAHKKVCKLALLKVKYPKYFTHWKYVVQQSRQAMQMEMFGQTSYLIILQNSKNTVLCTYITYMPEYMINVYKGPRFSEKYQYFFHCPLNVPCSILSYVFWIFARILFT